MSGSHEYSEHCNCEVCDSDKVGCPRCTKRRANVGGGYACIHCTAEEQEAHERQMRKLEHELTRLTNRRSLETLCCEGLTDAELEAMGRGAAKRMFNFCVQNGMAQALLAMQPLAEGADTAGPDDGYEDPGFGNVGEDGY